MCVFYSCFALCADLSFELMRVFLLCKQFLILNHKASITKTVMMCFVLIYITKLKHTLHFVLFHMLQGISSDWEIQ